MQGNQRKENFQQFQDVKFHSFNMRCPFKVKMNSRDITIPPSTRAC
jgi:hypothetical protein